MSIIRVHKTSNFTVMSNYHFKERKMSLKAKGLLSLMLSLPDDWDYSVSGLATLSKDGKDSVMSALGELEKFGYLTRVRLTNDKGQFAGIEYNIFEEPQPKKPIVEKPILANTDKEKPILENRPQLNTNHINNLSNKISNELNKDKEQIDELLSSLGNTELIEHYWNYIDMRKEIQAPLTARALKLLISRNERLTKGNVKLQKLLLENATLNEWKNIYLPGESEVGTAKKELTDDFKDYLGLE